MLFQVLLLLQLCLSLNQAATLNKYESQTFIHMKYVPRQPVEVCQCQNGKCTVNADVGAQICQQMLLRFESKANPNQYLIFCEIVPDTCTKATKPIPDFIRVQISFDMWYLYLQPFYIGADTGPRAFKWMLETGGPERSIAAQNKTVEFSVTNKIASMPFEFTGVLNLPATDADKYYYCTTEACINTLNQFCNEVVSALKVSNPVLMEKFTGCTVRRIYPVGENLGIHWSIMVHYRRLIEAGKLTKMDQLENELKIMKEKMKLPSLLKSFEPYRVVPLDFCEISAQSVTNQKYFEDIMIPVTSRYLTSAAKHRFDLIQQLLAGEDKHPTCFRHAVELQFSAKGKFVGVQMRLFYSLTCFKQRGLNSCQDVTKEVASIWNKGSKMVPSEMGTNYSFRLLMSGVPMAY